MNVKELIQQFNEVWLITEFAAMQYAALANNIRAGKFETIESKSNPASLVSTGAATTKGNVLVIPINGPIMKYDNCGSLGTQSIASLIKQANVENSIDAIVLNIDSPGGAAIGTEELANVVAQSKKPIVSFANGTMASAAYWIGSNSREIMISGLTTTLGSIGTMAVLQKNNETKEYNVFLATKSTRKNKAYNDALNGDPQSYIEKVLDPINNVFMKSVEKGRVGKIDLLKEDVLEGDIYMGKQAIKVGLADSIGSLEDAIKKAFLYSKSLNFK